MSCRYHRAILHNGQRRSVTLVGEADRKILKAAIKHAAAEDAVRHRQVPSDAVAKWATRLDNLKNEISEILQEEKEEKRVRTHSSHCLAE